MRTESLQAVVFDLDGTLADTLGDIATAVNYALERHGLPIHPPDSYRDLVGEGVRQLVERALPAGSGDLIEPVLRDLRDHYVQHMLDHTRPYPGVVEMLDRLAARAIPMAVLSNKPQPATCWMVDRLFGPCRFEIVVGGRDNRPLKPDPAELLTIVRRIGVDPPRCAFVGDTRTDMETAVAAGTYPIGVAWGFRDPDELVAHGARVVLQEPGELLDLLDGRPTGAT